MMARWHLAAAMVCAMALGASSARAQCDYGLTIHQSSELAYSYVTALAVYDDGSGAALVAGGTDLLEVPGGSSIDYYHIAKWNPKSGWVPLGEPNQMSSVRDVQVFEGDLYATIPAGLHRWTGAAWVATGDGLLGWAQDIVVFDDGSGSGEALFVMTTIFESSAYTTKLFKLDRGAWHEVAHFDGRGGTMEVMGGSLFVAGQITSANAVPVNSIASWDGQAWSDVGGGVNGWVVDLIEYEIDGGPVLVTSGAFTQAGATTVEHIACWNGREWRALPDTNIADQIRIGTLGVWDDGRGPALYACSRYELQSSGDQYDTLCRLDQSTNSWHALGTAINLPSSGIFCMLPYHDGTAANSTLFVGGHFWRFNTVESSSLVRILPQPLGAIEPLPSDPRSLRGDIRALAKLDVEGQPHIHAGGSFQGFRDGPGQRTLVARFDGESWTSIGRGSGAVWTLKTLDDGTGPAVYAGGPFSNLTPSIGQAPSRIAKWDGVNWIRMGSLPSTVNDLCMHDDGTGPTVFAALGNATVVKWNAGSQTWTTISTGFSGGGTNGPWLIALVSFDDGSGPALYVGGRFDAVGGVQAANIARWRGTSGGWQVVGAGRPGAVGLLHVHDDGSGPRLIATAAVYDNGVVAQWNGSEWTALGDAPSNGFNPSGGAITTFDDGGGPALIVSSHTRMARWNGESWMHLPNFGARALLADGHVLYMGEVFSIWSPGLAKLEVGDLVGGGAIQPDSTITLRANIVHGGAVNCQWRHNGVPLDNIGSYVGPRTNELTIYGVRGSHEGVYDIVVSNDCTELVSEVETIDVIGSCVGDIVMSDIVDQADVLAVLEAWGACLPSTVCPADITHDGVVDIDDLLLTTARWGPCP